MPSFSIFHFPFSIELLAFASIGACVGSFLNVVIYRAPRGLSVMRPSRSFCPACQQPIPWYRNIPLVSWLLLRGKCADCGGRISIRYWLVELLTAGLFAGAYALHHDALPVWTIACICLWLAAAIAVFCIDAANMVVIPLHTVIGALAGVLAAATYPPLLGAEPGDYAMGAEYAVFGAGIGYLMIRLVIELGKLLFGTWKTSFDSPQPWHLEEPENEQDELTLVLPGERLPWSQLFSRPSDKAVLQTPSLIIDGKELSHASVTISIDRMALPDGTTLMISELQSASGTVTNIKANREAMGYGDAWIMMMVGALCGWNGCLFTIFAGSLIGIVVGLCMRIGLGRQMPFGPSLLAAAIIWIFGGSHLWDWYVEIISAGTTYAP